MIIKLLKRFHCQRNIFRILSISTQCSFYYLIIRSVIESYIKWNFMDKSLLFKYFVPQRRIMSFIKEDLDLFDILYVYATMLLLTGLSWEETTINFCFCFRGLWIISPTVLYFGIGIKSYVHIQILWLYKIYLDIIFIKVKSPYLYHWDLYLSLTLIRFLTCYYMTC